MKVLVIYLFFSPNDTIKVVLSHLTCKPNFGPIISHPFDENWLELIKEASANVSRNSSNCQEILGNSLEVLAALFNDSIDNINQTSNMDQGNDVYTGRSHNTTYNIDFFQSLTVLVSKASQMKMEQCLKAKGTYHSQTGICIKEGNTTLDIQSFRTMETVKIVGNSISILALIFLLAILFLFQELRTIPGKYMSHISAALLLGQALLLFSPVAEKNDTVCICTGVVIHWTYLTVFSLMCVTAIDTTCTFCQPTTMSQTEKTRKYNLAIKTAYGFPLIIITPCIITQLINPSNIRYGDNSRCFITNVWANLITFVIPIGCILLLNCVCLTVAVYRIYRVNMENTQILGKKSRNMHRIQALVVVVKLGTYTGLGWIFGFLGLILSIRKIVNLHGWNIIFVFP